MKRLCLIEVPGLTRRMVESHAPNLNRVAQQGQIGSLDPDLPAVTMTGHASLMTGQPPTAHGVVGNGWFDRAENVVKFWSQSEKVVTGESIWDAAKKHNPQFTALKHFWWPGMASSADVHVNVRPVYYADGRKAPDIYTNQLGLAAEVQRQFGTFPMFQFWGPGVGIASSDWIAKTGGHLIETFSPDLSLIYLPHLDYKQQTLGPNDPSIAEEIRQLDEVAGELIDSLQQQEIDVLLVSGYHMNQVDQPILINQLLRQEGWLKVIRNDAGELIDYGMSDAFAVADHQVAHVYVSSDAKIKEVATFIEQIDGVAAVYDQQQQSELGLAHDRSGDLVVLAKTNAWFVYYYWLEESAAPDFARTIAIHAKPGYDPCEMLFDERLRFPKLAVATRLARKLLGMRYLMDVVSTNPQRIRGSHGLKPENEMDAPVWLSSAKLTEPTDRLMSMTAIKPLVLNYFGYQ